MTTAGTTKGKAKSVKRVGKLAVTSATSVALLLTGVGAASAAPPGQKNASPTARETLKILTWVNPPEVSAQKVVDAAFEKKYPNITVNVETAADTTGPYLTLVETAVDSHNANIVSLNLPVQPLPAKPTRSNESVWQYWATSGVFLPLNGQPFLNRYSKSVLAEQSYNGKVYAVSEDSYQEGVFYNKADFAKYHLSVPSTLSQFLQICQTLAANHVTPLFVGLGDVGPTYLSFIYQELMAELWAPHVPNGALADALVHGTTSWTSPYFIQVMNEEKEIAKYLEPGYTGVSYENMPGALASNEAAMLLDGSWDVASVLKANPKVKIGFFPLPGSNNSNMNVPLQTPTYNFAIVKDAPDRSAALKWLAFLSEPQNYDEFVDSQGASPTETVGKFTSSTAGVVGSWAGKGDLLDNVFPPLPAAGPYYDEAANWPDLQLSVIQGSKTPEEVARTYESGWPKVVGS